MVELSASSYSPANLPEQVASFVNSQCDNTAVYAADVTLSHLAATYLNARRAPTRLTIRALDEALSVARDKGFGDKTLNSILAMLDNYID